MAREEVDDPEELDEDLMSPALEIPAKYLMWRSHPSGKKRGFPFITKDIPLANLSEEDLIHIRMRFDLMMQNISLIKDGISTKEDLKVANEFLESQILMICNSSVGFKGYGRSLDTTMIQLKEIKREELSKKRRWGWRR